MFEAPQPKEKSSRTGMWIGIAVVVGVVAVAIFFLSSSGNKNTASDSAGSAPAAAAKADPTSDLRVTSAKMENSNGTAVWLIDVRNRSNNYSYNHIAYETTYGGADGSVIAVNHGEIPGSIGAGEESNEQVRDAAYPANTAWYKVKITGATATAAQ
jgi:hypothetical protein